MIKTLVFASASLFLLACSPKKSAESSPAPASEDASELVSTAGLEYCSDDKATNCFLETRNGGRSEFYTTQEQMDYWLTREYLSDMGIKLIALSKEEYAQKSVQEVYPRTAYNGTLNVDLDVSDADGNIKLPGRGAGGAKLATPKVGKFFSDMGKKFKRRPGQMSGKGLRLGFKGIFGTFGLAALLPLVQSIWDTFSPPKKLLGDVTIDMKVTFQGESIIETVE